MENSEIESPELTAKLKSCDPKVQQYLVELKAENFRLQKQITKLEAKNITSNYRILALEDELKEHLKKHIDISSLSRHEKENLSHELVKKLVNLEGGWDEYQKKHP